MFSTDENINFLRNQASHVLAEYAKANAKIDAARRRFEKTREHVAADFEQVKKSTFENTRDAALTIREKALDEDEEIREFADLALMKVQAKIEAADLLVSQIDRLGESEYPLH